MTEYILGFPTGKEQTLDSLTQYTQMQDAASSTSYCCGVYAENLDKAKERFMRLFEKANSTVAPHKDVVSVLDAAFTPTYAQHVAATVTNTGVEPTVCGVPLSKARELAKFNPIAAFDLLVQLYERMCQTYENNYSNHLPPLAAALTLQWDESTTIQQAMEDALGLPHKKLTRAK